MLLALPLFVIFEDFRAHALDIKLLFNLADRFEVQFPKSDLRFDIVILFKAYNAFSLKRILIL